MKRFLAIAALMALSACGVDGPPERPATAPGIAVQGDAQIGMVGDL